MIVCTNGQTVVSTYHDTEWNDNAQYQDHTGVTNAFKCNPKLVAGCLGDFHASMNGCPTIDSSPWSHEKIASIAVAEVPFSVDYT